MVGLADQRGIHQIGALAAAPPPAQRQQVAVAWGALAHMGNGALNARRARQRGERAGHHRRRECSRSWCRRCDARADKGQHGAATGQQPALAMPPGQQSWESRNPHQEQGEEQRDQHVFGMAEPFTHRKSSSVEVVGVPRVYAEAPRLSSSRLSQRQIGASQIAHRSVSTQRAIRSGR